MKHEKISIKWKIFLYLLVFVGILLVLLWLIQICYLDTLYKGIRTRETEAFTSEVISVLQSDSANIQEQIDALAAQKNMIVYVGDVEGNVIYSAEYIPNSRLDSMSKEALLRFYEQAKKNGGAAKVEFEGGISKVFADMAWHDMPAEEENPVGEGDPADMDMPAGVMQNHEQERAQSVIYANIVPIGGDDCILLVNAQLTPVDATVNTLRVELVWITIVMIVLSLVIALLISRQVSKSLIRINASAKEMAGGNLTVHFEGKDYREVAELSDTLNMTARELEKSERLRRELIANVSHDLRTPLTMIIAYAEVMRDLPGENSPENLQVVIDEAERLTNLVNDMLDISKLQAGVLEKRTSVYNLTESIESVLERYNKLKEQEGYAISFSYNRKVMVEADEDKIFQVIYNLVNNAINYTGEDRQIWVRQCVKDNGYVRIEVTDSGEGIAPEALPYVWDRYYKVDKTHKRAVMGTGLGLSIVKNILELHGARYGVESGQGVGSTFWFELKMDQP